MSSPQQWSLPKGLIAQLLSHHQSGALGRTSLASVKEEAVLIMSLTFRVLMEKAQEFRSPLYICFIDLRRHILRSFVGYSQRKIWHSTEISVCFDCVAWGTKGVVTAYGEVSDEFLHN